MIGLNRTGKSCRLRWVNYLHPGLKRGKMTPQEEKLVLELHAKWGNRWSRIARKLPGRTDNEIKNYWRTHMRKMAQEKKRAKLLPQSPPAPPSSSSSSSSASSTITKLNSSTLPSFYDTGGEDISGRKASEQVEGGGEKGYTMDDIWKDIESTIEPEVYDGFSEEDCNFSCPSSMVSPPWNYYADSLWKMGGDDDESDKMLLSYEYGTMFLTG